VGMGCRQENRVNVDLLAKPNGRGGVNRDREVRDGGKEEAWSPGFAS